MNMYINNDERYGFQGPFEADSKDELVEGMMPTFIEWADEEYGKIDSPDDVDYDEFVSSAITDMRKEFEAALEEIPSK